MAKENLWGTSWSFVGLIVTNGGNAIDSLFNDATATVNPNATGNFTWNVITDTIVGADELLDHVDLEVRFYGTGITNSVFNLELWDGSAWHILATYNGANLPPAIITTVVFNVTSLLNTVSKINNAQVRFNCTTKKANEKYDLDEIELVVTSKNRVNVNEAITIAENVAMLLLRYDIDVLETVSVLENFSASPSILFIDVLDPFYATVNEAVAIVEATVQVGIVMDTITALDGAVAFIPELYAFASRTVAVGEFVEFYAEILLEVYEDIIISENISNSLPFLLTFIIETIATTEQISIFLDVLCVDAFEPFGVLLTEEVNIVDLIVEVGVITDEVYVSDFLINVILANLVIDIPEEVPVTIIDTVLIDITLDIFVDETLTVQEVVNIIIPSIDISYSVYDDLNIDETVDIILANYAIEVSEDILIEEDVSVIPLTGIYADDNVNAFETIDLSIPIDIAQGDDVTTYEISSLEIALLVVAGDDTTTEENFEYCFDVWNFEVIEDVGVSEEVELSLDILCVDVLEPFHCLITEWGYILDLVIELGVVMEAIYVDGNIAEANLDNLFSEISDDVTVDEQISILIGSIFINVGDDIISEENFAIWIDELNIGAEDDVRIDDNIVSDIVTFLYSAQVDETIAVDENVDIFCDVYFISATDNVSLSESIGLSPEITEIDLVEDVSTSDYAQCLLDILSIQTGEDISVVENTNVFPDTIYLNVQDPFGVLITEHIDIIDSNKEVGVVDTKIYVTESISIYLDILCPFAPDMPYLLWQHHVDEWVALVISISVVVSDNVSVSEQAQGNVSIRISVSDSVLSQEIITIIRDPLFVVSDVVVVSESASIAESSAPITFSINVSEQILISDSKTLCLDRLSISIFEPITVSEYFNLLDLVVEIPLLVDSVAIVEITNVVLAYSSILSISVFDSVVWLGDFYVFGLDPLSFNIYDSVVITEHTNIFDIIVELEVGENVAVVEFINVPAPFEEGEIPVQIYEDITVSDFAQVYPIILRFIAIDGVVIDEVVSTDIGNLWFGVFSAIAVNEIINVDIEKNLEIHDSVSVIESAYLIMEGFIPRPPIIFDYHRYPTDSVTFEYDSRTITLPY